MGCFLGSSIVVAAQSRFPEGFGAERGDKCKNTRYSCALLAATEVSTSGFDHHGDGGTESDRASRSGGGRFSGESLSCLVSLMREEVLHLS